MYERIEFDQKDQRRMPCWSEAQSTFFEGRNFTRRVVYHTRSGSVGCSLKNGVQDAEGELQEAEYCGRDISPSMLSRR